MVVNTQSESAKAGQKSTIEFLLTSHPLDCPVCDKGGECPLQNLTMAHGAGKSRFLYDEKLHLEKRKPLGELIYLDQERCISAGAACDSRTRLQVTRLSDSHERGRSMQIMTSRSWVRSLFSGNTTDICPWCAHDCRLPLWPDLGVEAFPSICANVLVRL
jgi:NADH-quinone oxidoreductase subunit G